MFDGVKTNATVAPLLKLDNVCDEIVKGIRQILICCYYLNHFLYNLYLTVLHRNQLI